MIEFLIVLLLLAAIGGGGWYYWQRQQEGGTSGGGLFGGGRERRLAVVEQTSMDGRRKLVLIRRDGVEHLIMTGGPVDVVVETGIAPNRRPAPGYEQPRAAPQHQPHPGESLDGNPQATFGRLRQRPNPQVVE